MDRRGPILETKTENGKGKMTKNDSPKKPDERCGGCAWCIDDADAHWPSVAMFDDKLNELIDGDVVKIMKLPGVYEIVAEAMNNEVLLALNEERKEEQRLDVAREAREEKRRAEIAVAWEEYKSRWHTTPRGRLSPEEGALLLSSWFALDAAHSAFKRAWSLARGNDD
jgi:hypothetical protein